MSLMKKDNETVRHFALRVQQLVKKEWCNENAATRNPKTMKFSQKDNLKSQKVLLTKDKLNMYQHYSNNQYHSTHLFVMWILKTSLMKNKNE